MNQIKTIILLATLLLFASNAFAAMTATVTAPNGGETLSGTTNITFSWTDDNSDSMTRTANVYYSTSAGAKTTQIGSAVTLSASPTTETVSWNTTGATDRTYFIDVQASNQNGDLSPVDSSNASFTVSNVAAPTTAPTVSINSGATYTTSSSVTLTIGVPTGATECAYKNDSGSYSSFETAGSSKTWSLSSGDGSKTVTVKCKNAAGESPEGNDGITLDATNPILSISFPNNGASTTVTSINLQYNGSDSTSGIDKYEVRVDSNGSTNNGLNTNYNFTNQTTGSHTYYVRAYDKAGNNVEASVTVTLNSSSSTPTSAPATIRIIFDYPVFVKRGTIPIKVTVSPALSDNAEVRIKLSNLPTGQFVKRLSAGQTTMTFDFNVTERIPIGETKWSLLYEDPNTGDLIEKMSPTIMIVDVNVPTATWDSPSAGQTLNGTTKLAVTAQDDWSGIKKVVFFDGSNKIADANKTGLKTFESNWNLSGASAGNHSIKAVVTDNSGNVLELTQNVVVETQAPAPIVEPTPDQNNSTPGVTTTNTTVGPKDANEKGNGLDGFAGITKNLKPESIGVALVLIATIAVGAMLFTRGGFGNGGGLKAQASIVDDLNLRLYKLVPEKRTPSAPNKGWPGKQQPKENRLLGKGKLERYGGKNSGF